MSPPPVPSATSSFHNAADCAAYAAWIGQKMMGFDSVLGAVDHVNLPVLMGQGGTVGDVLPAVSDLSNSSNKAAAALVPDWLKFRQGWSAYTQAMTNAASGPGFWTIAAAVATMGTSAILQSGYTAIDAAAGASPWDQLKAWHSQLFSWADRFRQAGLAPPDVADLPNSNTGGGPSSTTITVFAVGVGALGAYLGWTIAPIDKPVAALIGAVVGGGGTVLLLR